MLYPNYTTKLLGLKDAIITNVEQAFDRLHIFLELERATHICPVCGTLTAHIHDYRTQIIKDLNIRKQQVFLHLRKQHYACPCCNKRFQEDNSFLMCYLRITTQLQQYIITCFADFRSAMTDCFPNTKVVANKFHVGMLLNWALEQIRKEIQKRFLDCRRKYFKKSRCILLKRNHNLKPEE